MKLLKSVAATALALSFAACGQGSSSQTVDDKTPAAQNPSGVSGPPTEAQNPSGISQPPTGQAAAPGEKWVEVRADFTLYLGVPVDPRAVSAHKFQRVVPNDGAVRNEVWIGQCQFVIGPFGKTLWVKDKILQAAGDLEPNPLLAGSQYYTLTRLEPAALACAK
jgi:hypothetical protein